MAIDVNTLKADAVKVLTDTETFVEDFESVVSLVNDLPDVPGVTEVKDFVAKVAPYLTDVDTFLKDVLAFLNG